MASPAPTTTPELEQLHVTDDTICKGRHRDLRLWNRQKAECCFSCGAIYTLISDLHSPLKFGDEIRLLQLLPSNDNSDDLIGDLIHVRLGGDPRYEAVSYTWADEFGDASPCGTLFIKPGDGLLKITRNCEAALRRFRSRYDTRLLWIDSICIDQQNSLERSEQVQMMGKIYGQAQRVLVFTGNPSELELQEYSELFQYIKDHRDHVHFLKRNELTSFKSWIVYDILSHQNPERLQDGLRRLRDSLIKLLGHSWFHRIWIIQEVIMSRAATLHFGPFTIDWEDLVLDRYVASYKNNFDDLIMAMESTVSNHIPPVLRLRKSIKSEGAQLVDLLSATRRCAATDPRDKIFALLGMAKEESQLKLPHIDYTRSVGDVFAEATAYHVRSTGRLGILSSNLLHATNAASWASDFSGALDRVELPVERDYMAPVERRPHRETPVRDHQTASTHHLSATGTQLDTIAYKLYDENQAQHHLNFDLSLQNLFQILSDLNMPEMLLHCPPPKGPGINSEAQPRTDTTMNRSQICHAAVKRLYTRARVDHDHDRVIYVGEFTVGIVPKEARSGDDIWALSTMTHPLVLRKQENGFQVIGLCMIIDPNNDSGCTSQYHRRKACDCTSCTSRATYNQNTWGSKDIVLV